VGYCILCGQKSVNKYIKNKEKQQRFRDNIKRDAEKYQLSKQKEHERYLQRKRAGKNIADR